MTSRAVLDLIGFPPNAPGTLDCRLRRVHYRAVGSVIDDGTRSGNKQTNCHRLVLTPGDDIEATLNIKGYGSADTATLRQIAEHEWDAGVLGDRRAALRPTQPTLRLVVRALGFDVAGMGEMAVGLGKAIIAGPEDVKLIEKASFLLLPGDSLDLTLEMLRQHAADIGFLPPVEADCGLLRQVTAAAWTPERIAARERQWLAWERVAPIQITQAMPAEFMERMAPLGQWHQAPPAQPEPMRAIN